MQGCSERGEREDIRGEGSICAQGEVSSLDSSVEQAAFGSRDTNVLSHLRLEHELLHKSTARAPGFAESQITAAPPSYLGSGRDPAGKHCTACISLTAHSSTLLIGQKRASSNVPDGENREFNWTRFTTSLIAVQIISSHQDQEDISKI